MKKQTMLAGVVLVSIAAVAIAVYLIRVWCYQSEVASITVSDVDLSVIPDGTYTGECNVDFIYAKVEVTVEGGAIKAVDILEHKNERGAPAEAIADAIVKEQRLDVDAVTGATNSSRVIKKAVENALAGK